MIGETFILCMGLMYGRKIEDMTIWDKYGCNKSHLKISLSYLFEDLCRLGTTQLGQRIWVLFSYSVTVTNLI